MIAVSGLSGPRHVIIMGSVCEGTVSTSGWDGQECYLCRCSIVSSVVHTCVKKWVSALCSLAFGVMSGRGWPSASGYQSHVVVNIIHVVAIY